MRTYFFKIGFMAAALSLSAVMFTPFAAQAATTDVATEQELVAALAKGDSVRVATPTLTLEERVEIPATGVSVAIDLAGNSVTVKKGIHAGVGSVLTLLDSSDGESGTMNLESVQYTEDAILGGNKAQTGGAITITSGNYNLGLTTYTLGAAIGAGYGGEHGAGAGQILISGGNITARGSGHAATIGGGGGPVDTGSQYKVTISGGKVNVISHGYGSAIGGGFITGTPVEISGGEVHAVSKSQGVAAIGGGYAGKASEIKISGGTVHAQGGNGAAAIGGGSNGTSAAISISDAVVTAIATGVQGGTASTGGAAIGAGAGASAEGSISIVNSQVSATASLYGTAIGGGFLGGFSNIAISGPETVVKATSMPDTISMLTQNSVLGLASDFTGQPPQNFGGISISDGATVELDGILILPDGEQLSSVDCERGNIAAQATITGTAEIRTGNDTIIQPRVALSDKLRVTGGVPQNTVNMSTLDADATPVVVSEMVYAPTMQQGCVSFPPLPEGRSLSFDWNTEEDGTGDPVTVSTPIPTAVLSVFRSLAPVPTPPAPTPGPTPAPTPTPTPAPTPAPAPAPTLAPPAPIPGPGPTPAPTSAPKRLVSTGNHAESSSVDAFLTVGLLSVALGAASAGAARRRRV